MQPGTHFENVPFYPSQDQAMTRAQIAAIPSEMDYFSAMQMMTGVGYDKRTSVWKGKSPLELVNLHPRQFHYCKVSFNFYFYE